jgi:signal recognition particle subunit SEC65
MTISFRRSALWGLILVFGGMTAHAFDWAPVNPDELKMTAEPKAPGAGAIILEVRQDNDDSVNKESEYFRMKIFTEEGRGYANVEIRYEKSRDDSVGDIEARVIHPDGTIVNFNGTIYDKLIAKSDDIQYQAKVFTLPDVTVGSIIEYHFTRQFFPHFEVAASRWNLSRNLFIKHGRYSLRPSGVWQLQYGWPRGLPPGTSDPIRNNGRIVVETHDVQAVTEEDHMPPELETIYHADFFYNILHIREQSNPEKFWQEFDKIVFEYSNKFMDKNSAMEKVVSQLVEINDSPEQKLRKIYSHVQQLRNLTYEKAKTKQEIEREDLKWNHDVTDVDHRKYGSSFELTELFVALARAAGLQADLVQISSREDLFFDAAAMNPQQLSSRAAVVTLDNKATFFQPGVPRVPFGKLPWDQTGVTGLRIDKDGGSWIKTPMTKSNEAQIQRRAHLKLEDDSLVGTVVVTYTGLQAASRRFDERNEDSVARKDRLEAALKGAISTGCEVELTNEPDWTDSESPLKAEYKVKISGWVSEAGKRSLLAIGIFSNADRHTFEHESRQHPVYFRYPGIVDDDIVIDLPPNTQVASLPKSRDDNVSMAQFSTDVDSDGKAIHITRQLDISAIYIPQKYYPAMREFYQGVRAHDDEQIVLTRTK